MTANPSPDLLQIVNLRVAYPPVRDAMATAGANHSAHQSVNQSANYVVDGVSLTLAAGERLGLVGESGCGKSTLGRAVMRLLPPQSRIEGEIRVAGTAVGDLSPEQLRRFRGESVALVFQDPMTRLNPVMTIGDHCLETLQAHVPHLSRKEAKARAIATLETVKIPANRWSQYPHEFSGGMRQRVAIALALLLNPHLIIADEPTTSLDVTVSAQILDELTRLCQERNMGLLLISHDLALVGEYCDRLAVMHNGQIVEQGNTLPILQQPQHGYTRSLLQAALHLHEGEAKGVSGMPDRALGNRVKGEVHDSSPTTPHSPLPTPSPSTIHHPPSTTPLLKLDNLRQYYTLEGNLLSSLFSLGQMKIRAVDGVSLAIQPGEVLGLVGESGCGKSTLSRTILHLIRPTAGRVEFLGQNLTDLKPSALRQQRRQMQMVFQDPHACLNPMMTVGQNITEPLRIHRLAAPTAAKQQVLAMLERVGLTPAETFYRRYPSELSGGQQQRVAIARALITRPQLVICDEPVSMLDASVQAQVLDLMLELKQEFNLTYLFITHDLWVARFICDRIAVMQAGQIVEIGDTETIFTQPQHPYTQTLLGAAPLLAKGVV